jgi:hypothetical protein
MRNNRTIGYDETKKMLNTLRNFQLKTSTNNRINEQAELNVPQKEDNDVFVVNDVDVNINSSDKSDLSLNEEEKNNLSQLIDNFKTQVSQIVDFEPGFTINQNQIRLDGTLTDDDINFVLISGEERGLYINGDMLKIEPEKLESLNKLLEFQKTFVSSTEQMINQRNNNFPTKED